MKNESLANLEPLSSLTSIGSDVYIIGDNLFTDLSGLENLATIGGVLSFQYSNLTSLSALANLSVVDGPLGIYNNDYLESLSGLDGLDPESLNELAIMENDILSTCEVLSVCSYLAILGADVEIENNATGCNSIPEVEEACVGVSVDEVIEVFDIHISRNPCKDFAILRLPGKDITSVKKISLYSSTGQPVYFQEGHLQEIDESEMVLDVSGLQPGIYVLKVLTRKGIAVGRIIICD